MVNPHDSGVKAVTLTGWNALLALTALLTVIVESGIVAVSPLIHHMSWSVNLVMSGCGELNRVFLFCGSVFGTGPLTNFISVYVFKRFPCVLLYEQD